MTAAAVFTPEAVRVTLLAAGLTEHLQGLATGFFIADARASRGEILVEPRREIYGTGIPRDWTGDERAMFGNLLQEYLEELAGAGYEVVIDMRMVVVTAGR